MLQSPGTLHIGLLPLPVGDAQTLLGAVWGAKRPDDVVLEAVIQRGAGVPLFLLELARYKDASGDFVPASIAELLRARIDQLGTAKETAQLAAVIDAELEYGLLEDLTQRRGELLGDLNQLKAAGILETAGGGRLRFRHALLRDGAYQSLPRRDRQHLHREVVRFLEEHRPELKASRPWLLALHHHRAGDWKEAIAHGETAAMAALMRFDNLEALDYARQLKGESRAGEGPGGWLQEIDDSAIRSQFELRILAIETTALMMTRGWADAELDATCRRARQLFPYSSVESTMPLRYALAQLFFNRGLVIDPVTGRDRARPYIDDLVESAERVGMSAFVRLGQMMLGAWHLFHGQIEESVRVLQKVEPSTESQDAWQYGFDAHVGARSVEGLARWFRGDDDVLAFSDETMRRAVLTEHPATLAIAQLYRASLLELTGDRQSTLTLCDDLLALCERYGLQGYPGYAVILRGWAVNEPAVAHQAREFLTLAGQQLAEAYYATLIAEAEFASGATEAAWSRLQQLETLAHASGESYYLPQILFLKSRCGASMGLSEGAVDDLVASAIIMAADQGARGSCASIVRRWVEGLRDVPDASRRERVDRLLAATAGRDVDSVLEAVRRVLASR